MNMHGDMYCIHVTLTETKLIFTVHVLHTRDTNRNKINMHGYMYCIHVTLTETK